MAELVIGAIGLVALESTVDSLFTKAATWRHHGKDFEQYSLSLDPASIAYRRWTKSVKLTDGHTAVNAAEMTVASEEEAATVVKLLGTIQLAFQNAEKTMERYAGGDADNQPTTTPNDLAKRANEVNKARQSSSNALQKARWVFHDAKTLRELAETVSSNVDGLIRIFPPAIRKVQEQLAALDLREIVPSAPSGATPEALTAEKNDLSKVRDIAATVDGIMQQVADEAVSKVGQRHDFQDNISKGRAKVMAGDIWSGSEAPKGPGHSYKGNQALDDAKVQYGDMVNQSRNFWDD